MCGTPAPAPTRNKLRWAVTLNHQGKGFCALTGYSPATFQSLCELLVVHLRVACGRTWQLTLPMVSVFARHKAD